MSYEYIVCDILCAIGYLEWMAIVFIIIYTIREGIYGQDTDTKDCQ